MHILARAALHHPLVEQVDLFGRDVHHTLIVASEAHHKYGRHTKKQIYTHLLMILLHEVGLTRQQIELANLLLQLRVVRVHLVQTLERLHHIGLQWSDLTHLKIVDSKHRSNGQHKHARYHRYRSVNILIHFLLNFLCLQSLFSILRTILEAASTRHTRGRIDLVRLTATLHRESYQRQR